MRAEIMVVRAIADRRSPLMSGGLMAAKWIRQVAFPAPRCYSSWWSCTLTSGTRGWSFAAWWMARQLDGRRGDMRGWNKHVLAAVVCIAAAYPGSSTSSPATAAERAVLKRISGGATLSATERATLSQMWKKLDAGTISRIHRRFGKHLVDVRLIEASRKPAAIMDRAAFDKHLRSMMPDKTPEERAKVLGYYFDRRVTVNGNQTDLPLTVAHERLHQLSDPRFKDLFGSRLNEGVTENFSREIHHDMRIATRVPFRDEVPESYMREMTRKTGVAPEVYSEEQNLANMLVARVGEEPVAKAYFKGDLGAMREALDSAKGKGAYGRFVEALLDDNFAAAARVLR